MKKVFSFCNQKGGVGKTTTTINLAAVLATSGYRVLVLDMDSQGNSTSGLGEEKPSLEFTTYQLFVENSDVSQLVKKTAFGELFLVPANPDLVGAELELMQQPEREYKLRGRLEAWRQEFDYIFLDCPPSLGLVTLSCLVASDAMMIPLQCEYYALEGLGQLLHTYELVRSKLHGDLEVGGVLLTMADLRTNLTQQVVEEVRKYFQDKVFETLIPRSVKLSEAPSFGKPAVLYDAHNRGSRAYREAAIEFEKRFSTMRKIVDGNPAKSAAVSESEATASHEAAITKEETA